MRHVKVSSFVVILIAISIGVGFTQEAYRVRNATLKYSEPAFPMLSGSFDVISETGQPLIADKSAIAILEDGRPVPSFDMKKFGETGDGIAYLIVLDGSGSMKEWFGSAVEALTGFVDSRLREKDRVALISFNDNVRTAFNFNTAKSSMLNAIPQLKTGGRTTQLYLAVSQALDMIKVGDLPSRRVMVVISDGKDESRDYTLDGCIRIARDQKIPIYSIGVTPVGESNLPNMQRLAKETGGTYVKAKSAFEVAPKMQLIVEILMSRYMVSWQSGIEKDAKEHKITFTAKSGDTIFEDTLGFVAPAAPVVQPKEQIWKDPKVLGALGGIVFIIVAVVVAFILYSRKASKKIKKLQEDQQVHAGEKGLLGMELEHMRQEVKGIEQKIKQPVQARVEPLTHQQKRRTSVASATEGGEAFLPHYNSAKIFIKEGPLSGSTFPLLPTRTTLGREMDNNIVLEDSKVSAHHACIDCESGVYYITDVGSSNGTYINQTPIKNKFPMENGHQIKMGGVILIFLGE